MEIFCTRLPRETTEADLLRLFEPYRAIGVRLAMDRVTGQHKGFAFVEFWQSGDGMRAVAELDGTDFMGREIVVRPYEQRSEAG